ncbi:hypothetical protein F1B92_08185 [Campylobacter sp. FMV-PI01]|uniref:Uncharacterized protein n=1 Tax=Campylobacter portucalensis TaxID=2608384 RepID=A0A6L5WJL2_9BACT|nr:hypothetical protein [Campylobacter portucalensis]MSN97136.1 hypothetical protein [Campylobacter portucalensis]
MENKNGINNKIPMFMIKDYSRKFLISSTLLMSLFTLIYLNGKHPDSVFHIQTLYLAVSGLVCIFLFGYKTSNHYFYKDKLKYNIGEFRVLYKITNLSDIDKILLIENTRIFISVIYNETTHKNDKKLYIFILYFIYFFDLLFSIIFKILRIFKNIKTDLLVFIDKDDKALTIIYQSLMKQNIAI